MLRFRVVNLITAWQEVRRPGAQHDMTLVIGADNNLRASVTLTALDRAKLKLSQHCGALAG
ncbi:MAG: hypothetical protein ABJF23_27980 [Bryobacteraceae bacterium]